MNYRSIRLLLPTEADVKECQPQIPSFVQAFSGDTITTEIEKYSDMNVLYQATMASATVNFIVLVNEPFFHAYDHFGLNLSNIPLCSKGPMVGYFQYLALNAPKQRVSTMTVPMNFDDEMFLTNNYQIMVKNATDEATDCSFIKSFLTAANSMPHDREQWNVLLIHDPYPSCMKFDLNWSNENVSTDG